MKVWLFEVFHCLYMLEIHVGPSAVSHNNSAYLTQGQWWSFGVCLPPKKVMFAPQTCISSTADRNQRVCKYITIRREI